MVVGGKPEVPGYPRDQIGQILRSPEPAKSGGTTVYRGGPEMVGASLCGSETQDKAKSVVY
jgi:hypothetical protein